MPGTCRSCGAPVVWASFPSGKRSPFTLAPAVTTGLRWAIVGGRAHRYGDDDARMHRDVYVSHFSDCPDAGGWRR